MPRPSLSRILLAALLVFVLTVPSARAEEPASSFSLANLLDRAWGGLVSLWMENGCILDPSGSCTTGQAVEPSPDNGCGLDPNGGCLPGN